MYQKIQIFHSFGTQKVALFSSFIKIFLPNIKIYHTINVGDINFLFKPLLCKIDQVFTSTNFYKDFLKSKNISLKAILIVIAVGIWMIVLQNFNVFVVFVEKYKVMTNGIFVFDVL